MGVRVQAGDQLSELAHTLDFGSSFTLDDTRPGHARVSLGGSLPFKYDPRLTWLGTTIKRMLTDESKSFGLAFLSDSTGNDVPGGGSTGDWPYEFGALIAAAYPDWTVQYSVFSDVNQNYPRPTVIQTGVAGTRYLAFAGVASSGASLQIADVTRPTDLDIAVKVALDAVNPATAQTLLANFGSAGNRGYRFYVENGGTLRLQYTSDGTTLLTDSSVSTITSAGAANGVAIWLRVTLDVDNGSAQRVTKFYTSTDGVTWTQLGATVTTAGAITLFPSTQMYEFGARQLTSDVVSGKFYEIAWQSAIDSNVLIAPALPELWGQSGSLSPSPSGAPILHLAIGCVPTKGLSYLDDTTRLPKMLPYFGLRAVFMATSHNDSAGNVPLVGSNYLTDWTTWITNVKARAWGATPVIVTQNPRVSPAQQIGDHALRRELQLALAEQLGLPMVDGYQAFVDTNAVATYTNADGIHPLLTVPAGKTYSGAQIWARDVYAGLFP